MADKKLSLEALLTGVEGALELSDTELEGIAGGVIGPTAQTLLLGAIDKYKNGGTTLDEALEALPGLFDQLSANPLYKKFISQTNLEEVTEFVKNNW